MHNGIIILWFQRISDTSRGRSLVPTAEGYLGCVLHSVALTRILLEKLWHKVSLIAVLQSDWQVPENDRGKALLLDNLPCLSFYLNAICMSCKTSVSHSPVA